MITSRELIGAPVMRSEQRLVRVVVMAAGVVCALTSGGVGEERPAAQPSIHAPTPGNVVQPVRPSEPVVAAKTLFGAATQPAPLAARAIGSYAKGCLAGGTALPVDGPAWQAMRLSRNRNWGHPKLIDLVQKFANDAKTKDGWPGLLVGDLSQPRGGPMLTGHASHQIGLDADIWFTPMPDRRLTNAEREEMSAISMLRADDITLDDKAFTPQRVQLLKRAASYPDVERILVHPVIKKAICDATASQPAAERAWLGKVRPIWGHYYHFHIRIGCPAGSTTCKPQKDPTGDDGCGKEVADWLKLVSRPRAPPPGGGPIRQIELDQLPAECRAVLEAGR
jgi:penicillin-insensitive murein DD-endopeptidase